MVSLTLPAQTIKTEYQLRAEATRARRQAAGRYQRPTKAQAAALGKSLARGGRQLLTIEELGLLANHPHLAASQRAEYAQLAQAAIESAVAA